MLYDPQNIFAKMLRGEVPCHKIYEDEHVVAFPDIAPVAPVHVLVVPKGEYVSFDDFMSTAPAASVQGFFSAVRAVAEKLDVQHSGYRLITNHGRDASQSVPHFHVHLIAGRPLGGLVTFDTLVR